MFAQLCAFVWLCKPLPWYILNPRVPYISPQIARLSRVRETALLGHCFQCFLHCLYWIQCIFYWIQRHWQLKHWKQSSTSTEFSATLLNFKALTFVTLKTVSRGYWIQSTDFYSTENSAFRALLWKQWIKVTEFSAFRALSFTATADPAQRTARTEF